MGVLRGHSAALLLCLLRPALAAQPCAIKSIGMHPQAILSLVRTDGVVEPSALGAPEVGLVAAVAL
eukprot:9026223-Pyramimonas_sp.AAC.1